LSGGGCLIIPDLTTDIAGAILIAVGLIYHLVTKRGVPKSS
jgi:hypothetical protein